MATPYAKTVLLADDREDVRKALRALLGSRGYQVTTAASPRQVLDLLATQSIGLALSRQIAEAHGASLQLGPAKSAGCLATLTLPIAEEQT